MRNFVGLQPSGICRWVTRRVTLRPPWASACIMSVPETTTAVCDTYGSALSSALMAVTITFAHIPAIPLPRRTSMLVQVNPTRPKIQEYSLWSKMLMAHCSMSNDDYSLISNFDGLSRIKIFSNWFRWIEQSTPDFHSIANSFLHSLSAAGAAAACLMHVNHRPLPSVFCFLKSQSRNRD